MNKIQININKNNKNMIMDLEGLYGVMNMFKPQKLGPLVQNPSFAQSEFMHFLKNCPTCTNHNPLNFLSYEGDLGLFGNLKMSPTTFMLSIFPFEVFIFM